MYCKKPTFRRGLNSDDVGVHILRVSDALGSVFLIMGALETCVKIDRL